MFPYPYLDSPFVIAWEEEGAHVSLSCQVVQVENSGDPFLPSRHSFKMADDVRQVS